jgi:hypothetical protein
VGNPEPLTLLIHTMYKTYIKPMGQEITGETYKFGTEHGPAAGRCERLNKASVSIRG